MRITLENFKGVADAVTVLMRPITRLSRAIKVESGLLQHGSLAGTFKS